MPAAEFHEPARRQVQKGNGQNPHRINEREVVTIADGPLREIGDDGAVKDWLMECERYEPCHRVQQVEMQDVVEQRHASIDEQDAAESTLGFGAIKKSEQGERWAEGDEQVI